MSKKTKHLITYEKRGKTVGRYMYIDAAHTSSEAYGEILRQFAKECGAKECGEYATLWRMYEDCQTKSGVYFDEELCGPGGMSFVLFQTPDVTDAQIRVAKKELKASRDVVCLRVMHIFALAAK